MGKGDKRLLALAIALILLAMVWFAQFSQAQQNAIYTSSIVQILDATKTAHAGPMALKIPSPPPMASPAREDKPTMLASAMFRGWARGIAAGRFGPSRHGCSHAGRLSRCRVKPMGAIE